MIVLVLIAHSPPIGVVLVLLSSAGIAADGLDVAARIGADPDVLPRRRNGQGANAGERRVIMDRCTLRFEEGERLPAPPPLDARCIRVGVFQVCMPERLACLRVGIAVAAVDILCASHGKCYASRFDMDGEIEFIVAWACTHARAACQSVLSTGMSRCPCHEAKASPPSEA